MARTTTTVSENHPDGAKQNADGTYTFQGITYDPTTYTVTVEVTDEGNGKISAVVTDVTRNSDGTNVGTGNGAISFTNHYAVSEPGTVEIEGVTKVLKGQDMSSDKQFSFLVVDGAGNTVTTGETQQAALAGEQAQVVFAPFIVEDEGTYEYWIVENNGGQTHSGIAYDDARFHVVVTATDNGMGGLDVAVSFDEGVTPAVRERVLPRSTAARQRSSSPRPSRARTSRRGKFGFVLSDLEGNAVAGASSGALSNGEPGKISFTMNVASGGRVRLRPQRDQRWHDCRRHHLRRHELAGARERHRQR